MISENTFVQSENKLYYGRDAVEAISLLSYDEYQKNKNEIPLTKCWWWINAPGAYKKNAMYVFLDGEVYTEGYRVDSERAGVRPVIFLNDVAQRSIRPGDKIRIGNFDATVLGDKSCLLDEIVCNRRFDETSNSWEKSELKEYVESDEFMKMIFA